MENSNKVGETKMKTKKTKKEIETEIACLQTRLESLSDLYDLQLAVVNDTGAELQNIKQEIKVKRVILEKM